MRHIEFKHIGIKNFLSIGEVPVKFHFTPGINVITGVNHDKEDSRNGVGKSAIGSDAIHFALFGTTIRDLSKEFIVNSFSKKNCCVILEFNITDSSSTKKYKITRSLFPTKCFLEEDGNDITLSTLPKTNELIQSIINCNSSVFQNSVVMTMNNTTPFMAQVKLEKRKFIENILQLEVFSKMLDSAKKIYSGLKKEYDVCYVRKESAEKSFNINKHQLEIFETAKNERISNLEKKIEKLITDIIALNGSIRDIDVTKVKKLEEKKISLNKKIKEYDDARDIKVEEKAELKHQLTYLRSSMVIDIKAKSCPTCKRDFEITDVPIVIDVEGILKQCKAKEKEIKDKEDEIEVINSDKAKVSVDIQSIVKEESKITEIKNTNKSIKDRVSYLMGDKSESAEELKKVSTETNDELEKLHKELLVELKKHESELERLNGELAIYETIKFIMSEEGVKTFIVKKILNILNARLSYYLERLEANCHCMFDEYFEEHIIDERGQPKSYFNFSGGERKRLDLACLFAFLDVRRMQGDTSFSVIFYDELLDSAIDNKGIELVLAILRDRFTQHKESSYIITHRGNVVIGRVDNTLLLEKRNGFTYISK